MEHSRYHPRPLCGDSVGPSKWSNFGEISGEISDLTKFGPVLRQFWSTVEELQSSVHIGNANVSENTNIRHIVTKYIYIAEDTPIQ